MQYNVLSLFDGISCMQEAMYRAEVNISVYYASEVDRYAKKIANKNFPQMVNVGDIKKLDNEFLEVIAPDILVGGSPCQSFSFAGAMKGACTKGSIEVTSLAQYLKLKKDGFAFEGQSYLVWEYMRILNITKPKWFFLENVVMLKKWEEVITKAIGVSPHKVNSSDFSAQNRCRLYWTNIPFSDDYVPNKLVIKDILEPNAEFHSNYPKWMFSKWGEKTKLDNFFHIGRKASTLSATMAKGNKSTYCVNDKKEIHKYTVGECEVLQTLPVGFTSGVSNTQRYKTIGNGMTVEVLVNFLKNIPK